MSEHAIELNVGAFHGRSHVTSGTHAGLHVTEDSPPVPIYLALVQGGSRNFPSTAEGNANVSFPSHDMHAHSV